MTIVVTNERDDDLANVNTTGKFENSGLINATRALAHGTRDQCWIRYIEPGTQFVGEIDRHERTLDPVECVTLHLKRDHQDLALRFLQGGGVDGALCVEPVGGQSVHLSYAGHVTFQYPIQIILCR